MYSTGCHDLNGHGPNGIFRKVTPKALKTETFGLELARQPTWPSKLSYFVK